MNQANLTRFGPRVFECAQGAPTTFSATFRAIDGAAKLVLQNSGIDDARIEVNGHAVVAPQDLRTTGEIVVPLTLQPENTIEVRMAGASAGAISVRVTQLTQADLGLLRQGYFGLNTSDMARQRAFYDTLGFKGEIYPAGPETSTTFARALGFPDDYLIHVSLHSLEDPPVMPFVDTVQFRGDSYRDEPPYPDLNHIGMTYATYSTTDLDGDFAYLQAKGVDFVSAPATAPNGERFVFLKDQDGTFLKLIQAAEVAAATSSPALVRLVNTNMNVADLERSREFYRLLGFTESAPASLAGADAFAAAHGFDGPIGGGPGFGLLFFFDPDGIKVQLAGPRTA